MEGEITTGSFCVGVVEKAEIIDGTRSGWRRVYSPCPLPARTPNVY